jgi:hypothetical protein
MGIVDDISNRAGADPIIVQGMDNISLLFGSQVTITATPPASVVQIRKAGCVSTDVNDRRETGLSSNHE